MMLSRFIYCCLLLCMIGIYATAQQLNYPIIEERGQKFYLYTVEAKEGLYSVSHKFNITQADILNCNPSIADGLKAGQTIKIPLSGDAVPTTTAARQHTVIKKQTLYSIAYQYGVTVEAIVAANPQAANGIKEGDVLQIPAPKQKTEYAIRKDITPTTSKKEEAGKAIVTQAKAIQTETPDKHTLQHRVIAGETFYSLSRVYNVTIDAIKNANPTVEVLKTNELINIPSSGKAEARLTPEATPVVKNQNTKALPLNKSMIRVAILLPFSLDGVQDDPTIEKFVDFYRGILIALSGIKEKGISVEAFTYDIAKTVAGVSSVLAKPELSTVDLIIGPAYATQIKPVADFAKKHKIYAVIPFTQKVEGIDTNPYLFQFNPSINNQYAKAAALFAKQFRNHNIIIAHPANGATNDDATLFTDNLTAKLKQLHVPYHSVMAPKGNLQSIKTLLNNQKPPVVVLATANTEKAAPYLSAFAGLNTENKHIPLYGFLDWEPETNVYPNLYYTSLFYTHSKSNLAAYNQQYTQWFKLNPNSGEVIRFDLLGYDLAMYFISQMSSYGIPGFTQHLSVMLPETIGSRFAFKKISLNGGYINNELHLLNYKSEQGVTLTSE